MVTKIESWQMVIVWYLTERIGSSVVLSMVASPAIAAVLMPSF